MGFFKDAKAMTVSVLKATSSCMNYLAEVAAVAEHESATLVMTASIKRLEAELTRNNFQTHLDREETRSKLLEEYEKLLKHEGAANLPDVVRKKGILLDEAVRESILIRKEAREASWRRQARLK